MTHHYDRQATVKQVNRAALMAAHSAVVARGTGIPVTGMRSIETGFKVDAPLGALLAEDPCPERAIKIALGIVAPVAYFGLVCPAAHPDLIRTNFAPEYDAAAQVLSRGFGLVVEAEEFESSLLPILLRGVAEILDQGTADVIASLAMSLIAAGRLDENDIAEIVDLHPKTRRLREYLADGQVIGALVKQVSWAMQQ